MEDLKDIVNEYIIMAESLNMKKQQAIQMLENRFNECPVKWKQHTKKFIDNVKENIETRDKLIKDLRLMIHSYIYKDEAINPVKVDFIIKELQGLDDKDALAADIYKALMDEMI